MKPPDPWPVPAMIGNISAGGSAACGRAMLRAQWARHCRMRVNPEIEAAVQGQTSPRGSGETVRMGDRCHDLTASDVPSGLASVWSSGFEGRLNSLCAKLAPPIHGPKPSMGRASRRRKCRLLNRFHALRSKCGRIWYQGMRNQCERT